MPRINRGDHLGSLHHVMNRGLAKRTIFERKEDIRFFLSQIAKEVRRKRLNIYAFCIMPSHFHLLVKSIRGELSDAMMEIQGRFARWFNLRRKRSGPLFRSRFRSVPIISPTQFQMVVRYLDANPVTGGIVTERTEYPYGSARMYLQKKFPAWLEAGLISKMCGATNGVGSFDPTNYERLFTATPSCGSNWLIKKRIASQVPTEDDLNDLINAAPKEVKRLIYHRSLMADGANLLPPVIPPEELLKFIHDRSDQDPHSCIMIGNKEKSPWPTLSIGLLRATCCLSYGEISNLISLTDSTVIRHYRIHKNLLSSNADYSRQATEIVTLCLYRLKKIGQLASSTNKLFK